MAEPGPDPVAADLPALAARLTAACRVAGLPVGPDRASRFAAAVVALTPETTRAVRHCAAATLASAPEHLAVVDAVIDAVFAGIADPADRRRTGATQPSGPAGRTSRPQPGPVGARFAPALGAPAGRPGPEEPRGSVGSDRERLAGRDFAELDPAELALLADAMQALRMATPLRRTRRTRRAAHGGRVDVRASLRAARDTGGDPARLARRLPRREHRRLVVLCDISGSMQPYARALIQFLYCAAGAVEAEVYTFATRLTRLTGALARTSPAVALARAGALAPDWAGGTRIGESLRTFNDTAGIRGAARGAVVLICSDGWDGGDPAVLDAEMARLARVAYRIVWANPRARRPGFTPLTGGMAAAWPHCDAVVSAHSLDALEELLAALARPARAP
ncbi:vWA domain-containing protein [Pseudonocardia sp.]|uniref:vWA domain-containing protein n=1 Tax=Pseudonocardia sp. TaxID=60912 RepID=UPI003D12B22F